MAFYTRQYLLNQVKTKEKKNKQYLTHTEVYEVWIASYFNNLAECIQPMWWKSHTTHLEDTLSISILQGEMLWEILVDGENSKEEMVGIIKLESTPFLPLTLPGTTKPRCRMSVWFISQSLPFPILMDCQWTEASTDTIGAEMTRYAPLYAFITWETVSRETPAMHTHTSDEPMSFYWGY